MHDPAITVKFKLLDEENTFFLAWTTTPWTLPSNLALAVGETIEYVKVVDGEEKYILARERLEHYYKDAETYKVVDNDKGLCLAPTNRSRLFRIRHKLKKNSTHLSEIVNFYGIS